MPLTTFSPTQINQSVANATRKYLVRIINSGDLSEAELNELLPRLTVEQVAQMFIDGQTTVVVNTEEAAQLLIPVEHEKAATELVWELFVPQLANR